MTRTVRILSATLAAFALAICFVLPGIAGAAQVTVRPPFSEFNGGEGLVVVVPLISRHEVVAQYRLRHGYREMYNIALGICEKAYQETSGETANTPVVTGFASSVARFNAARRPLIPLMRRLGIGYPPSLEDFSEISQFVVPLHEVIPPKHSSGPYLIPVGQAIVGSPFCRFELTT